MNRIIEWDLLTPEDIEVRVATTRNGKTTLLLFQDSRCAMRAVDKQFGNFGWQMDYKVVGDQIYGTLSIYDEEKDIWVAKSDTGDKSNISEDKGQSSDILKRCIVRWGYARELYTAPKIVVDDDGYGCSGYKVSEINYDGNRKIIHLVLVNRFGKEVFRWDEGQRPQVTQVQQRVVAAPQNVQTDALDYVVETEMDKLKKFYQSKFRTMSPEEQKIFTEFKDFYKNKIEKSGWKGNFDVDNLWIRWKNNNMNTTQTK